MKITDEYNGFLFHSLLSISFGLNTAQHTTVNHKQQYFIKIQLYFINKGALQQHLDGGNVLVTLTYVWCS